MRPPRPYPDCQCALEVSRENQEDIAGNTSSIATEALLPFPAYFTCMLTDSVLAQVPKDFKDPPGCFLGTKVQQVPQAEQVSALAKAQAKISVMTQQATVSCRAVRIRTCLRPEALLQHWRERLPLQLLNELCMTEGWKLGALLVWSRDVTWGRPSGLTVGGKGGQHGHSQLHKMLANGL